MEGRCWMRPRVYMIDFETAVEFAPDTPPENRLCNALPVPADQYRRQRPDELTCDPLLYCPFSLDVWQFGYDLVNHFAVRSYSHVTDFYWQYCRQLAYPNLMLSGHVSWRRILKTDQLPSKFWMSLVHLSEELHQSTSMYHSPNLFEPFIGRAQSYLPCYPLRVKFPLIYL